MSEIWKDIPGYEGLYQISNLGNVKSLPKIYKGGSIKEKILKNSLRTDGYCAIKLYGLDKPKSIKIHRLVLNSFDPITENKQVNHKNGIKTDNRLENLEWCTSSENQKHKYNVLGCKRNRYWKGKFGENHNLSKKIGQYDLNGNLIKIWNGGPEIFRNTGYRHCNIYNACRLKQNTAYGFIWKYE